MKKHILFTILFVSASLVTFGQSRKEKRQIKQANMFVQSITDHLPDATKEEKTKFYDFKLAQIKELEAVSSKYERGTEEHKTHFKAVLTKFQKDVKAAFGNKRGSELIRASLAFREKK